MGFDRKGREDPCPPWIFIDGTDKVEGSLMVLFFGIVFTVGVPWKFFAEALDSQFPCVQHKKWIV